MAHGRARKHILVAGASGTIGRAVCHELVRQGCDVTCLLRPGSDIGELAGAVQVAFCQLADVSSLPDDHLGKTRFDAVISCIASRTGVADEVWAVDYRANLTLLRWCEANRLPKFVLLSAICVQKPLLAFQHAKLAFEAELAKSDMAWTIVRPTAFFKSLSGQVARCVAGKAFLVFGDGQLTACKPISDRDLARFLVDCAMHPQRSGRIFPIGGPGPAITPNDQAAALSKLLGRSVKVRRVPLVLLKTIAYLLKLMAKIIPPLAKAASYAEIGLYYAQESMLVLDPETGRYEASRTPETGSDTLIDHYAKLIAAERESRTAG